MKHDKAYKVLGLVPGCSKEEIKEAYVTLSKKYHPEEYPKEFQEIHEAYKMLSKRGRPNIMIRKKDEEVTAFSYQWNDEVSVESKEVKIDYDFEAAFLRAKEREYQEFLDLVDAGIYEVLAITEGNGKNFTDDYEKFFRKKEYQTVFFTQEFMMKLADLFEDTDLRYEVYSYISSVYELNDKKVIKDDIARQGLKRVLEKEKEQAVISFDKGMSYFYITALSFIIYDRVEGEVWIKIGITALFVVASLIMRKIYLNWRIRRLRKKFEIKNRT